MQLNQLEALLAVMEQGSFLAAARMLGRRRATLQAQVRALEEEVGVELLLRGPQGVAHLVHPSLQGDALGLRCVESVTFALQLVAPLFQPAHPVSQSLSPLLGISGPALCVLAGSLGRPGPAHRLPLLPIGGGCLPSQRLSRLVELPPDGLELPPQRCRGLFQPQAHPLAQAEAIFGSPTQLLRRPLTE